MARTWPDGHCAVPKCDGLAPWAQLPDGEWRAGLCRECGAAARYCYAVQAWHVRGAVLVCGHPGGMAPGCCASERILRGETVAGGTCRASAGALDCRCYAGEEQ